MDIGLVAMSGKPVTSGHWSLITQAAAENDRTIVYVSTSDRKRKGELTILGRDMQEIWTRYLIPILPSNAIVEMGGSPVRKIYELMGEANETGSGDTFRIYGDHVDLPRNFPEKSLQKYTSELYANGQIELVPVSRGAGVDISGTRMREFLSRGLKDEFMGYLPPVSHEAGEAIWSLLSPDGNTSESLRCYIKSVIIEQSTRKMLC